MSATCRGCGQEVNGGHQCPGPFANRPPRVEVAKTCVNCRFAGKAAASPDANVFVCQRFPPTAMSLHVKDLMGRDTIQIRSFFPPVEGAQTCGEWKGEAQ
jgi:hypothetical protein